MRAGAVSNTWALAGYVIRLLIDSELFVKLCPRWGE